MVLRNNVISFEGSRSATRDPHVRDEYKGLIQSCRQVLLKALPRLMDRFFEQLDDALYQLADKAQNNQLQSTYFESMRLLRKQRDSLESDFNGRLLNAYDMFWAEGGSGHAMEQDLSLDESSFSLVEDEALEEGLALASMISRGENRFFRDLYALDQRFGFLAGGMRVDAKSNPLAPDSVVSCFGESCAELPVELLVRLVIYKQFEGAVVDRLGVIYDEINALLSEAGIVPQLRRSIRRTPGHSRHPGGAGREGRRESDLAEADLAHDEETERAIYPLLMDLLRRRRGGRDCEPGRPPMARSQLMGGLTQLQHQWNLDEGLSPADLRSELQRLFGEQRGLVRQIAQPEEDVIDIISMLFEFILEDRNLPDPMRAMLARLQIPMLKVALLDRRFFSRKSHPARRLLNTLAQAALGWSEDQGREPGGLYARIEDVVEQVIEHFEDDLELFERLLQEFSDYIEQERQSAGRTEQRTAQVVEGKEKLGRARQRVNDVISQRLVQYQGLPHVVETLVREAWRDVLLLTALQKGEQSEEWAEQLRLLDRLLWSLLPKQEQGERQRLLKAIPDLLKGLRSGLTGISYDQHKMTRLFKELQACHILALRGQGESRCVGADAVAPDGVPVLSGSEITDGQGEPGVDSRMAQDRFDALAAEMAVGSWLEWHRPGGPPLRAKLSWRSELSGSCLFVNRRGLKVIELTREGFAEQLRSGGMIPLCGEEAPLLDRALHSLLEQLQSGVDTA